MENNIEKLNKLFQSEVKEIIKNNTGNLIIFKNGEQLQLNGEQMIINSELELEKPANCSFCKSYTNKPFFTIDDSAYICRKCTELAIKIFIENGINIDIEVDGDFPQIGKELRKELKEDE